MKNNNRPESTFKHKAADWLCDYKGNQYEGRVPTCLEGFIGIWCKSISPPEDVPFCEERKNTHHTSLFIPMLILDSVVTEQLITSASFTSFVSKPPLFLQ